MIQRDPGVRGVGLVILDEFHERSLQADLALALLLDGSKGFGDLRLLICQRRWTTTGFLSATALMRRRSRLGGRAVPGGATLSSRCGAFAF